MGGDGVIWWHRFVWKHVIEWRPWGETFNEARCSCGKRWIR